MNKVTLSGGDGLWARVAGLLRRNDRAPAYGQAAIGTPGKKVRPLQRIDEHFARCWDEAASYELSLCVLAHELDGADFYVAAYGSEALEQTLDTIETLVAELLPRDDDICLRTDGDGFVVMLPDMPVLLARELAGRIAAALRRAGLPNRESHLGQVTLSMGLAAVNPSGAPDDIVLDAAAQAVRKAQRRGLARLETIDLRRHDDRRRRAA